MNCIEFRQLKLADPYVFNHEASRHISHCSTCAAFDREIQNLDNSLRIALTVAVPEGLAAKVLLNQSFRSNPRRPTRWYWLSMAASFFMAVFIFQMMPADSLHADIVEHLDHEAHQVHGKFGDISTAEVRNVLYAIGGDIDNSLGKVTYASKCYMNEQLVAHFVVENDGQPYTLIIIPRESKHQLSFQSGRWHGVIMPHATGSLAVVAGAGADSTSDLLRMAKHYSESIKQRPI